MTDKTPLWQAIADTLRAEITSGHYPPGDRLPSEAALATRFGVNRHTVRHALAQLGVDRFGVVERGQVGGHLGNQGAQPSQSM